MQPRAFALVVPDSKDHMALAIVVTLERGLPDSSALAVYEKARTGKALCARRIGWIPRRGGARFRR